MLGGTPGGVWSTAGVRAWGGAEAQMLGKHGLAGKDTNSSQCDAPECQNVPLPPGVEDELWSHARVTSGARTIRPAWHHFRSLLSETGRGPLTTITITTNIPWIQVYSQNAFAGHAGVGGPNLGARCNILCHKMRRDAALGKYTPQLVTRCAKIAPHVVTSCVAFCASTTRCNNNHTKLHHNLWQDAQGFSIQLKTPRDVSLSSAAVLHSAVLRNSAPRSTG
eukprot:gene24116-biopygen1325